MYCVERGAVAVLYELYCDNAMLRRKFRLSYRLVLRSGYGIGYWLGLGYGIGFWLDCRLGYGLGLVAI